MVQVEVKKKEKNEGGKKKGKRGFFGPRQRCSGVISIAGYTLWNSDNRVVSSQYSGVWCILVRAEAGMELIDVM